MLTKSHFTSEHPSVIFSFPLNILGKCWWILTKLCICIDTDNIYRGHLKNSHLTFSYAYKKSLYIRTSVRNIFVSAQYLRKTLMDFDQRLHMHWYWQHLPVAWNCWASIFVNSLQSYDPWMMSEFRLRSIFCEWMNGFDQILHMHWYWRHLAWDC